MSTPASPNWPPSTAHASPPHTAADKPCPWVAELVACGHGPSLPVRAQKFDSTLARTFSMLAGSVAS